jgi:hypothetical protein
MENLNNEKMTLIVKVTQPNGTEFKLTLENVSTEITLSQAVGTSVQRITDYLRLYKRNNAKLIDCRQDLFVAISIQHDGNIAEWISEKVQQEYKFKYRASTSEKGAKRLSLRIFDAVEFSNTPFKIVTHKDVQ